MRRRQDIAATTFVLVGLTLLTASAQADGPRAESSVREDYEQLLGRAVDAFNADDFAQARELFLRAYALRPSARLQRGVGMASLRLELYSEAHDMLSAALDNEERPLTASQRDEVSKQLAWMQANLGTVQLVWMPYEPRQYELRVDNKLQPHSLLMLSPGTHRVTISGPTIDTLVHTVEAHAGVESVLSCTWKLRAAKHTSASADIGSTVAARTLDESRAVTRTTAEPQRPERVAPTAAKGSNVFESGWFLVAVAVVVVGGVTSTVLLTSMPEKRGYEPTSVDHVLMSLERVP
jgi:hypothetical protein